MPATTKTRLSAVLVGAIALLVGAIQTPADAGPSPLPTLQTRLTGTLQRYADGRGPVAGGSPTVLHTIDGSFVPVDPAQTAALPVARSVTIVVPVPASVAADARAGRPVATATGPTRVAPGEIDSAGRGDGAAPTSTLARATATAAQRSGGVVRLTRVAAESLGAAKPAAGSYTPGAHDLYVAVVRPVGTTAPSATAAQVRRQVAAASAYWSDQSHGTVTFRLRVVSAPYTSAYSCTDNPNMLWQEAAGRLGFDEGPNTHLFLSLPTDAFAHGCAYGLATIGDGPNTGGHGYVADTAWPVLAHELGHNLGLDHAHSLVCSTQDTNLNALPQSCHVLDYGYPWDVMAASAQNGAGSLSSANAIRLGFLRDTEYTTVTSGTRTIALAPLAGRSGTRAVEAVDPTTGEAYYVEYRTHIGRDTQLYVSSPPGVRVLRMDTRVADPKSSMALDATPTSSDSDENRMIPAGRTFTSYTGAVRVTVRSYGATAQVVVSVGAAARRAR